MRYRTETVAIRYIPSLTERQVAEAARQQHAAWGGERSQADYVAHLWGHVERGSARVRYAGLYDGDALLVSLRCHAITLSSPWGPLDGIGIGSVYTDESARGRGYGTQLIQHVLADARDANNSVAMLYTDIHPGFYRRLGFAVVSHVDWWARVEALPTGGGLELTDSDEVEALLALYENSWDAGWVRMHRTVASWRLSGWRQPQRSTLLQRGDDVVGYVTHRAFGDCLWIADLVAVGVEPSVLWSTLRALAGACSAVAGWLRPEHAGGPFVAAPRPRCIPMLASLDGTRDFTRPRCHFAAFDHL
jgi:GNAT superfamily N-acetyltransferase